MNPHETISADLSPIDRAIDRLLAHPANVLQFERDSKPLIRACFVSVDGFAIGDYEHLSCPLTDSNKQVIVWDAPPLTKGGMACVQVNRAARALHYCIREVQTCGVMAFQGLASMVFLTLYQGGPVTAEVHRVRPKRAVMQVQEILEWLLSEYLLEFETGGYNRVTFVDWVVANLHLSPTESGGAESLEDWYRKRAQNISGQGKDDDVT